MRRSDGARARLGGLAVLVLAGALLPGCYAKRFKALDQSMFALQARIDSLGAEQVKTREELAKLRTDMDGTLRSVRAGSQTSAQELVGRIEQLEARLEEQNAQLLDLSGRTHTRSTVLDSSTTPVPVVPVPAPAKSAPPAGKTTPPGSKSSGGTKSGAVPEPAPGGAGAAGAAAAAGAGVLVDPTAAYDQAVLDFTQGRFPLALTEFRAFVEKYGTTDLADNAQYGVGESFYAQGQYDSATVAYRDVVERWPQADKVPAALYKLGISYQKMNQSAEARATYKTLIDQYPRSGEARLAEERLKEMDQR